MSSDDRAEQGRYGSKAVHHANPMTELLLRQSLCLLSGVGAAEDIGDRRRRESDDHAREDTKDDAEGDCICLRAS